MILSDEEITILKKIYLNNAEIEDLIKSHNELKRRLTILKKIVDLCASKGHTESCYGNYGKGHRCDCGYKEIRALMIESKEYE